MNLNKGFTVVELLITLIVGMLLLVSVHQFYSYILNDSADARARALASNLAYQYLREYSGTISGSCTAATATINKTYNDFPNSPALPQPASAQIKISCPTSASLNISLISVSVTYGSPSTTVNHATYVKGY